MPQSRPSRSPVPHSGLVSKKIYPQRQQRGQPSTTLAGQFLRLLAVIGLWVGAGSLLALCVWTSVVIILRPQSPHWLTQRLPGFAQGWGNMPVQSTTEIEAELQAQQRYAGDWMEVSQFGEARSLNDLRILPIYQTRSACSQNCETIVELRLYGLHHRDAEGSYMQLLDQMAVRGPAEETVLDPIRHADLSTIGSTYPLPLPELKPLYETGLPGGWFTLTGRWQNQGSHVLYGQLFHIDLQAMRLHSLLNWKSLQGRLPTWHNLDAVGLPELIVNQSVGLEPQFNVYVVASTDTAGVMTRLEALSLTPAPLPQEAYLSHYRNGLLLAQNGLWSQAQVHFTDIQARLADQWPLELERQRQLIRLHARISQGYADRDWSQSSQKLLALLLDGQWTAALTTLETPQRGFTQSVLPLLERNSARLWQRLTASLQVNGNQEDARLWGALILLAKENETAALQWLTADQESPLKDSFEAIAAKLQTPDADTPDLTPVTATTTASATQTGSFFGIARPLSIPITQWQASPHDAEPPLPPGQQWYEISVQAVYDRPQWQTQPVPPDPNAPDAIARFWQSLGLRPNSALQVISPTGAASQTLRIADLRWQGETPQILATGNLSVGDTWIVTQPGQWHPLRSGDTELITQVYRTTPELGDRLLSSLSRHLGLSADQLAATVRAGNNIAQVRRRDFTGDGEDEILLTLDPDAINRANLPIAVSSALNFMLSADGRLLYSDVWTNSDQFLIGWIQPPAGAAGLVTVRRGAPSLLTWNAPGQQFR